MSTSIRLVATHGVRSSPPADGHSPPSDPWPRALPSFHGPGAAAGGYYVVPREPAWTGGGDATKQYVAKRVQPPPHRPPSDSHVTTARTACPPLSTTARLRLNTGTPGTAQALPNHTNAAPPPPRYMLKYLVLLTGAFHLQAGATPVLLLPLTAGS